MRGKVKYHLSFYASNGITPAYAGKSRLVPAVQRISQDHPRLCGEKTASHCTVITWLGSPPPMRGKELLFDPFGKLNGITPAYAGKREFGMNLRILR